MHYAFGKIRWRCETGPRCVQGKPLLASFCTKLSKRFLVFKALDKVLGIFKALGWFGKMLFHLTHFRIQSFVRCRCLFGCKIIPFHNFQITPLCTSHFICSYAFSFPSYYTINSWVNSTGPKQRKAALAFRNEGLCSQRCTKLGESWIHVYVLNIIDLICRDIAFPSVSLASVKIKPW